MLKMKYSAIYGFLLMIFSFSLFASEDKIDAEEILRRADAIRCPEDDFVMRVVIQNSGSDQLTELEVFTKGQSKTLIKTLQPARDRGRNMLMLDEAMWAYVPNLKRAVRISLSQKLTGEAANGDISRMRWAGDYEASITDETDEHWVLDLKARKKGLTYEKIKAYVAKKNFRPLKAEYLSLSGLPLKYASFQDYRELAGAVRPGEIVIEDAKRKDQKSVIKIQSIEKKPLSDAIFNQNNLR
ncbi:MAG: outer membrane lipoprotein-sorting protein [Oligoflexus sp.]